MSLDVAGYLVVTVPAELRRAFMDRKMLTNFKEYWKRKIKRDLGETTKGENKNICGIIRYHWAGDDNKTFKPHLNILINYAFIDPEVLERWRHELQYWFKRECKIKGNKIPAANIYYQYTRVKGKIYHRLKYITRATLHNFESAELKNFFNIKMKNFKNTTTFGKFEKRAPLENEAQKLYVNNICPHTNEPITWNLFTTDIRNVVATRYTTEKGLGIFHAFTCHTALKNNPKVSYLGKSRKQKPIQEQREPGQVFRDCYDSDRFYYHLNKVDHNNLKYIWKSQKNYIFV